MPDLTGILSSADDYISHAMQLNIVAALRATVGELAREEDRWIEVLGRALSANLIPADLRQQAFQELGKSAQLSVQQAYTHRSPKRKKDPYRQGASPGNDRMLRYAGDVLLRALQDESFFQATPDGLSFINSTELDKRARQWRRLNFGAGRGAGEAPQSYPLQLINASLGLEPDPRPAVVLPPGFWLEGGVRVAAGSSRGSQFFPRIRAANTKAELAGTVKGRGAKGRANARMVVGIPATNFLDAGVRRIGNELGPTVAGIYERFFEDLPSRVSMSETLHVTPPTPAPIPWERRGY